MHTFQKKDKTVLTMNPFDKIGKQWMLITSGDEDNAIRTLLLSHNYN